jgi:hypothetical protein
MSEIRTFDTGANRDTSNGKASYAWRHPAVEQSHAFYMMEHAKLSDGSTRSMNNWWNEIPFESGFDSLQRHVEDAAAIVGGQHVYKERYEIDSKTHERTHIFRLEPNPLPKGWKKVTLEEALNAAHFNVDVCVLALQPKGPDVDN